MLNADKIETKFFKRKKNCTDPGQLLWDWPVNEDINITAQLHSTKPELRFCAGSNPARGMSEIHDGEDLWQWSRLEIRLNAFRRSTIPQKQFIIIMINWCQLALFGTRQTFLHWYCSRKSLYNISSRSWGSVKFKELNPNLFNHNF